ncbi:unnamed protein product [Prunus armeniaca]
MGACGLVVGRLWAHSAGGDSCKVGPGSLGSVVVSEGDEGIGCGLVGVDSSRVAAGEDPIWVHVRRKRRSWKIRGNRN